MASHLVGQNQIATFVTPVNGTTPIDANQVRGNDNQIKTAYNFHDLDPTLHIQDSILAARAAPGVEGRKWMTTDTGGIRLWYDTGSVWQELSYISTSAGGTFTAPVAIVTSTLPQFSVGFDAGHTTTMSVAADGTTTFATSGVAGAVPGFTFSNPLLVTGAITATGAIAGGALSGTSLGVTGAISGGSITTTGALAAGAITASSLVIGVDPGGTQLLRVGGGIVAAGVTNIFGTDTAGGVAVHINGAAGTLRTFLLRTASLSRWAVRAGSNVESVGDAGSDFQIVAFTDAGVAIDNPITIARAAAGAITLSRPLVSLGITVNNSAGIAWGVQGAQLTGVDTFHVELLTRKTVPVASTDPRPNNGAIYLSNSGGAGTPMPFGIVGAMVFQTRANNTAKRGYYWLFDDPAVTLMSVTPSADLNLYAAAPDNVRFVGNRARTSLQAPTPAQTNDALVQFVGGSYDTAAYQVGAMFGIYATETWSPTARGSELRFYTVPTTTLVQTLQWRILPAGGLRPETDAAVDIGSAAAQVRDLFASSSLRFNNASNPANAGVIRLPNAAAISWRNVGNTANQSLTLDATDHFVFSAVAYAPQHVSTAAAAAVAAGQIGYGGTTAAAATTGAAGAPPAQVTGYIIVNVAGVTGKIPYYNN